MAERRPLVLIDGTPAELPSGDSVPSLLAATQAEMESGTETALRSMSPLRVAQAIEALGGSGGMSVSLSGPASCYISQSVSWTIVDYDVFSTYTVTASAGVVTRSGATINYTAPATAQTVTITIAVNGQPRAVEFPVLHAGIAQPANTSPASAATDIGGSPTLASSEFAAVGLSDNHAASRWRIYQGGSLLHDSDWSASALTSYAVPGGVLSTSTAYTWTVEHRGTALGDSAPSTATGFTTASSFGGLIGAQGGQGFGVGICPSGALPSGFSALSGTTDPTSANYGNYQTTNGSIMVFVPRFYYRIGSASSPRYTTYGANAIDISGIDTFATQAAANAAGYAMPRAFIDGGQTLEGFFIDKYLASKDGASSCKSIANADPISLTTNASYNPSNGMTGCTGILADAVVLGRARGAGFHCASIFQYAALALLSLAHGQAATSATHCAWFDANRVTNFPKGCNNNALSDVNDGSVTYAASFSTKPKTRATANFAKTTHNGQESGVADLNGSLWQMVIGVTSPGSGGTDAALIANGDAYVLKTSASLADITGGWNGATDAWGNASNLATKYDLVSGLMPWGSATGAVYFGNGANQVFSGAVSGTDWLRTGCGIQKDTNAMSASGTNQFGNDYCYQYNRANLSPLASGGWNGDANAGVFCRNRDYYRSVVVSGAGFRVARPAFGS